MEASKLERLVKLLNLTGSNSDNEALTAIRFANRMLKEANAGWDSLVRGGGSSTTIYRDRIVEKIVYRDRVVEKVVEKIVYRDRPTEGQTEAPREPSENLRVDPVECQKGIDWLEGRRLLLTESQKVWLDRLSLFFSTCGYLSEKQFATLLRIAEAVAKKGTR